MKLKATKKQITDNFSRIYLIDYKYGFLPDAFAYNSGYMGWNWDAYDLGGICLIDGNRSFPKHKLLPKDAKKVVAKPKEEAPPPEGIINQNSVLLLFSWLKILNPKQ